MKPRDLEPKVRRLLYGKEKGETFNPADLGLEFEKSGDLAFDRILSAIKSGNLTEDGRIRGLRTLVHLARQFCAHRILELVAVLASMARDPSIRVRSVVVHIMLPMTSILGAFRTISEEVKRDAIGRMEEAIRAGAEMGISQETQELAEGVLQGRRGDQEGDE